MISLRSVVLSWVNQFFSLSESIYFAYFSTVLSLIFVVFCLSQFHWDTICGWHTSCHHKRAITSWHACQTFLLTYVLTCPWVQTFPADYHHLNLRYIELYWIQHDLNSELKPIFLLNPNSNGVSIVQLILILDASDVRSKQENKFLVASSNSSMSLYSARLALFWSDFSDFIFSSHQVRDSRVDFRHNCFFLRNQCWLKT